MLAQKGVPREKIKPLGIPIDPKFAIARNRAELAGNFGLRAEVPVVLIMGGGRGLGDIRQILTLLDRSPLALQLVVVCGLNKSLYAWVQGQSFNKPILKFKYTDQIDRLMSLASVIVTKPGGITTAEALAKRLPMIILDPIPGQETRNAGVLVKSGLAQQIHSPEELPRAFEKTLNSRHSGFPVGDPWSGFSKPHSSSDIARFVIEQC
jgi:processive 1,2-diacylglycerol beta-glucosyltransferase